MKAKVLKIDKKLFDGESIKIIVPASEGEICILPGHISIITYLKPGVLKIFKNDEERPFIAHVSGGICSFSDNSAVFILDS